MRNSNGKLYCPVCGEGTREEKYLVCWNCHETYKDEASESLVRGTVITLSEWVLPKAGVLIQDLRQKLSVKQAELDELKKTVSEETYASVKKATAGKYVERDVFETALTRKRKELWQEKGGNRLFAEVKTLEETIAAIEEIIRSIHERNNRHNHADAVPENDTPDVSADPEQLGPQEVKLGGEETGS